MSKRQQLRQQIEEQKHIRKWNKKQLQTQESILIEIVVGLHLSCTYVWKNFTCTTNMFEVRNEQEGWLTDDIEELKKKIVEVEG